MSLVTRFSDMINNAIETYIVNKNGDTDLHMAVRDGRIQEIKAMLDQVNNPDLNAKNNDGKTPLHIAIDEGRLDIVEILCQCPNINLNAQSELGETPLLSAVRQEEIEIAEFLLNNPETDREQHDLIKNTPLHESILVNAGEIFNILIADKNLNCNIPDIFQSTPIHLAAILGRTEFVRKLLDITGVSPFRRNSSNNTPILCSFRAPNARLSEIRKIYPPFDINDKNKFGQTALHIALLEHNYQLARELIADSSVNIHSEDSNQETPIYYVIRLTEGNKEEVEAIFNSLIRDQSFNPNHQNSEKKTLLHKVVEFGTIPQLRLLLQISDLDTNPQDKNGFTPLHYAAKYGRIERMQILLEDARVFVTPTNEDDETAIDLIQNRDDFETNQSLREIHDQMLNRIGSQTKSVNYE